MWCKSCERFTYNKICELCGNKTEVDIPTEIFWCNKCKIPIIKEINDKSKNICPLCNRTTIYFAKDIRPVFPKEQVLVNNLLNIESNINELLWCSKNRYFINDKWKSIHFKKYYSKNLESIKNLINNFKLNVNCDIKLYIDIICNANKERINNLEKEAFDFIKTESKKFGEDQILISFSGGKDSTVVASLVMRALSNPYIPHIFGDTTLEFPKTYEYIKRYKKNNSKTIFKIAKNKDQNFYEVCKDIGPPARMLRWCCTMFKTGPITRAINSLYRNKNILTFYGIRKNESLSRSKYDRVSNNADMKIQKQTVASPIFYWTDFDIWLYLLANNIDYNKAYEEGYDRVGCWCCPNNNIRAQFLSKIYMPELSKNWRDYLIDFAKEIGKLDFEEYVDGGWWKARQGGNGLKSSEDVKIRFTNCTAEENAKIYNLNKPIDKSLYNLFVPFGKINYELGKKILNEVIILDIKTNIPIISLQPHKSECSNFSIKIRTMNVKSHEDLQKKISYQIKKFNSCRKCLKCESVCSFNAITINNDGYYIDSNKCKHCMKCVTAKYITGGCLMGRFLRVKKDV